MIGKIKVKGERSVPKFRSFQIKVLANFFLKIFKHNPNVGMI